MDNEHKVAALVFLILWVGVCAVLGSCKPASPNVQVHEHTLPDGTRCAVVMYRNVEPKGITCDWR